MLTWSIRNHYILVKSGDDAFICKQDPRTIFWRRESCTTSPSITKRDWSREFASTHESMRIKQGDVGFGSIDVWSVHQSDKFWNWMKKMHPTLILDFIPGGCTGVHQPCDVGIQWPLKLSIHRSYNEDVVKEMSGQIKEKGKILSVDAQLPVVHDCSVRWLFNAYQAINNEKLVMKVSLKPINDHSGTHWWVPSSRPLKCVKFVNGTCRMNV